MTVTCPSCGSRDYIDNKTCVCGYHADDAFSETVDADSAGMTKESIKEKVLKKLARTESNPYGKEILIKEIDSWAFIYSVEENCICIGTAALKSFRLKLGIHDMENLLEQIYQYRGEGKTLRKTSLSEEDIPELVHMISKKIDEKRSRISLNLNDNELNEIIDIINMKLTV